MLLVVNWKFLMSLVCICVVDFWKWGVECIEERIEWLNGKLLFLRVEDLYWGFENGFGDGGWGYMYWGCFWWVFCLRGKWNVLWFVEIYFDYEKFSFYDIFVCGW